MAAKLKQIEVAKLVPGIYVDLQLNWTQHPFFFSRFKIKNWDEVRQIQKLGLDKVWFDPARSSAEQAVPNDESGQATVEEQNESGQNSEQWKQKLRSIEKADKFRRERKRAAQKYRESQKRIQNLTRDLKQAPANAVRDAEQLIDDLSSQFDQQSNMIINLVSLSEAQYSSHHHSLNVTVMALLLGHSIGLQQADLKMLGMGALLHDIGKVMLPGSLLHKSSRYTPAEEDIYKTHVGHGVKLVQRLDSVPERVVEIIAHHHCYLDGSGYPPNVPEASISNLSRVVTVADHYDKMCNPHLVQDALNPKEAMAMLYAQYQGKLCINTVQNFIKTFGVYPPGTVVELSDESIGLVISVDSKALLEPRVMIYNPDIPSNQALMLDLSAHQDLSIIRALKPGQYPPRVLEYLGIEERVGYYFEALSEQ